MGPHLGSLRQLVDESRRTGLAARAVIKLRRIEIVFMNCMIGKCKICQYLIGIEIRKVSGCVQLNVLRIPMRMYRPFCIHFGNLEES